MLLALLGIINNRNNIVILFLSFELVHLSSNLVLLYSGYMYSTILSLIYIFFIVILIGNEACVGLTLIFLYYSNINEVSIIKSKLLKF